MKTILIALVTTLSLTTFANLGKGTNLFPGYGAVSSSKVCLTDNAVRFTVPMRTIKTCVKYNSPLLGHNCLEYKTTAKKALVFQAPLSFEIFGCTETRTVYDSHVAKEVCTKTGLVMYHQPRTYFIAKTVQDDAGHTKVIYQEYAIPFCG